MRRSSCFAKASFFAEASQDKPQDR